MATQFYRKNIKNNYNLLYILEKKIPKIIFQTWKTKKLLKFEKQCQNTWYKLNPTYKFVFFDNIDCLDFIRKYYPDYLNIYINMVPDICKYDLIRALYLYKYGGVYTDFDTLCLRSIDEIIIPDDEMLVGLEYNKEQQTRIAYHFFAVKPEHPIIKELINNIIKDKDKYILKNSGSSIFTEIILENINNYNIKIFPIDMFSPGMFYLESSSSQSSLSIIHHQFRGSWENEYESLFSI